MEVDIPPTQTLKRSGFRKEVIGYELLITVPRCHSSGTRAFDCVLYRDVCSDSSTASEGKF